MKNKFMERIVKAFFTYQNDPKFKKKFEDYRRKRLINLVFLQQTAVVLILSSYLYSTFTALNDDSYWPHISKWVLLALIIVMSCFLVLTIQITYVFHWKRRQYSDKYLYVSNIFLLIILFELRKFTSDITYHFWNAMRIEMINVMYLLLYKSLRFKIFQITFSLIYFHARQPATGFYDSIVFSSLLSAGVCIFIFFQDRLERQAFFSIYHSGREKKAWKRFLDILPEGVIIMRKDLSDMFMNSSLKEIFGSENKDEVKQRLFEVKKKIIIGKDKQRKPNIEDNEGSQVSSILDMASPDLLEIEKNFQEVINDYISVRALEKKKTEMLKNKTRASRFFPNKTMNVFSVPQKLESYSNDDLKVLRERKFIESFSTKFQNKTLDIRITKTNFHESDALMVIVSDKTELIKLKVLEDINDFKNNIFASFSHELRTPLNCIFCFINVLEQEDSISDAIKKDLIKPMWCSGKILLTMVDNILDYTQITTKKLKLDVHDFDLKLLIARTVDIIRIQAEHKGLELTVNFENDKLLNRSIPEKFYNDSAKIEQILMQLLLNAIKFTFEGSISVRAECVPYLEGAVEISVSDTGVGMNELAKSSLEAILKGFSVNQTNFRRVTEHSSGGSLGLSVSHVLALKLGYKRYGGIKFESEFGVGSRFSFLIKNREKTLSRGQQKQGTGALSKSLSNTTKNWNRIYSLTDRDRKDYIREHVATEKLISNEKKNAMTQSVNVPKKKGVDTDLESLEEGQNQNPSSVWEMIPKMNSHKFIENSEKNSRKRLDSWNYCPRINSNKDIKPVINIRICDHPKVLIVDDDNFNILGLSSLLKTKGISSMNASNGKSAIELITSEVAKRENCCLQFKLIFMDINMPIMDGLEATSKIRALIHESRIPNLTIVALTSYINQEDKNACLDHGMDDYVTKPMDVNKMSIVLRKYKVLEFCEDV